MFRFAIDKLVTDCLGRKQWLYGGDTRNDVLAIKAAAKEFTGTSYRGKSSSHSLYFVPYLSSIELLIIL